ncbi:Histone-lysine N-methyltransferase 2D [Bienertia sinuspersici]
MHLSTLHSVVPLNVELASPFNTRKRYHCAQCNFDLHKVCAQSPIIWLLRKLPPEEIEKFGILHNIIDTFAHPQHSVIADYKAKLFRCYHCKNVGDGLRYYCDTCNITLHQVCAEHPTTLASHLHPEHELELKIRPHFKHCEQCGTKGNRKNNRMYVCKECDFYMHPECSQLPLYTCTCFTHYTLLIHFCLKDHVVISGVLLSMMGVNDEVRQNFTDHKVTVLPVANLISSYVPVRNPCTANDDVSFLKISASIVEIVSAF